MEINKDTPEFADEDEDIGTNEIPEILDHQLSEEEERPFLREEEDPSVPVQSVETIEESIDSDDER